MAARKRTSREQRNVENYAYAQMSVPTRRRLDRARSRARARAIYEECYARKRARSGNVTTAAPPPIPRALDDDGLHLGEQFHDAVKEFESELSRGEPPRHEILWRWLLKSLAPDAPDTAFGHWLTLARRWDYVPTAAELLLGKARP